jgi:hypothetical protein
MNEIPMKKNYFGEKVRKAKSSERGEAMPAAIVTAIVSSLILLGIASVVSLVIQNKADSEGNVALTTAVSNIDVSLRSDINQASYITAAAKLKQPTTRLLAPTDVTLSGVNMHIPVSTGECKVIHWNINGNVASRDLTIYKSSLKTDVSVKCDETSPVVAQRTKVFAENVNINAPFKFNNQVGRELAFTINDVSLATVNTELDKRLTAEGVTKLSDTEFNELNKLMGTGSYVPGFSNPSACAMDAAKVWVDSNKDGIKQSSEMVCPPAEAPTVEAAWNSLKIAKVSIAFQMQSSSGEVAKRDISQNSSVPLYANAAEAEASVADSSADNRPVAPTVVLSTSNVILGSNYTINWTAGGTCPTDMVRSYKVYENDVLVRTQSTLGYTKNYTNSATQFLNYNVQIECVRGALVVASDMSAVATAKVIPAVPALVINTQPPVTDAALNSNLTSTATCLYGTVAQYNIKQTLASYGTAGTVVSKVSSVNRAINNGFTVVEGARYQYQIEAWCKSAYEDSALTSQSTNQFVTVASAPLAAPPVVSPTNGAINVATNAVVKWNAVVCATGTTVKYFSAKTTDAGAAISQQVIGNWTASTSFTTSNNEGSTVGYTVAARCEGTAAISGPSPYANVQYTTLINSPSVVPVFTSPADGATNITTSATVTWGSATCAPFTNVEYYVTKNVDKNAAITPVVLVNWLTSTSLVSSNSQGNTVGYTVAARCAGPNADSSTSVTDAVKFTTRVIAPSAPTFTSPANGATGVAIDATVNWSAVTCTNGAVPQYYTTKNIVNGATMATPTVVDNWTSDVSYVSNNTEGNTVGYTVMARCAGPNANSANSATSTVSYTTEINAPNQATFITPTPANGSMYQATNSTLTWNAVTCATGTTAKYFAFKDMNAGAAITPINIYNWATNTSYVTNAAQGSTVRYAVTARCEGPNAISAETVKDYVKYTTKVDAPSGPWVWNDGWGTVSWNAPGTGCGGGATIQYRIHQVLADGGPMDAWGGWGTGQSSGMPSYNTGGYPQGAEIQARCVGPNDTSAGAMGNTTKWVKNFDVSFSAWQQWRRVNVAANCPFGTSVAYYNLYVAADGWWGARGVYGGISTDEGAWIADAQAGGGGNTGWINMAQNVNGQWNAAIQWGTTYNWGYWGNSGWGSSFNNAYSGPSLSGTYWNASGWGSWVYYAYGVCTTPYMHVYAKNAQWNGGGIRNAGTPWTQYDAQPQGRFLTQAGQDAIK